MLACTAIVALLVLLRRELRLRAASPDGEPRLAHLHDALESAQQAAVRLGLVAKASACAPAPIPPDP